MGYDPAFGARPLNRVVQRYIMSPLARALLSGGVRDEETVRFEVNTKLDELVLVPNHSVDNEQSRNEQSDGDKGKEDQPQE
jgi:ATP-dependent Clp protease ATP-binding subunit ClpA